MVENLDSKLDQVRARWESLRDSEFASATRRFGEVEVEVAFVKALDEASSKDAEKLADKSLEKVTAWVVQKSKWRLKDANKKRVRANKNPVRFVSITDAVNTIGVEDKGLNQLEKRVDFYRVMEILGELPEKERQAVVLRASNDKLSNRQIAKAVGVQPNNASRFMNRVDRDLEQLVDQLQNGGSCDLFGPVVRRDALGVASPMESVRARRHLGRCDLCEANHRATKALRKDLAVVLLPYTVMFGGGDHSSLLDQLVDLFSRAKESVTQNLAGVQQAVQSAAPIAKVAAVGTTTIVGVGAGVAIDRQTDRAPSPPTISTVSQPNPDLVRDALASAGVAISSATKKPKASKPKARAAEEPEATNSPPIEEQQPVEPAAPSPAPPQPQPQANVETLSQEKEPVLAVE